MAHIRYQRIQKTKALMRSKVFFLSMDNAIENEISSKSVVQPTKIAEKIWDTVNIDYLGPLPNGKYVLAMMDQISRYPLKQLAG